jgi:hyperosmotically inducible protein
LLAGIAAVVLSLVFDGCTQQQVETESRAIASAAPAAVNDAALVAEVEARLVQSDASSALHVAVDVHHGDATLSGKVKSAAVAARFKQIAASTSGVKAVVARLTIDRALPSPGQQVRDFALATAVRASLADQAGVNGLDIGVASQSGTVTLSGTVKTAAIKSTLLAAAKSTEGVKRVVDRLHVRV